VLTLRDLLLDSYMYQHVRQPTRQNNILELVISSNENMVNDVEILEHLGNCDHKLIVWKLICAVGLNTNKKLVKKYYKADYNNERHAVFQEML